MGDNCDTYQQEERVSSYSEAFQKFAKGVYEDITQQKPGFQGLVAESAKMRDVYAKLLLLAQSSFPILLQGPTGTGKDVAAQYIHQWGKSNGTEKPLVSVNCGAIPPSLVHSYFFGHKRGAFTNAVENREGWITLADGGTLFLNEIGKLPMDAQAILLTFLDTKRYTPVGSDKEKMSEARIVCATNEPLQEFVAKEAFREDLYYRLARQSIFLPALQDRKEDIPKLADILLQKEAKKYGIDLAFDPSAHQFFQQKAWPGNIRELRAFIETIVVNAVFLPKGPITSASLQAIEQSWKKDTARGNDKKADMKITPPTQGETPQQYLDAQLRQVAEETANLLKQTPGSSVELGESLQKCRQQLVAWMYKHGWNSRKIAARLGISTSMAKRDRRAEAEEGLTQ